MKHWKKPAARAVQFLLSLAVAGGAAVLADPGFGGYIAQHPGLAALVPLASALLHAAGEAQPWQITIQRKPDAPSPTTLTVAPPPALPPAA